MGERKGTNKYYPPDFNPKFHKSLNAYHKTHALRERGRKAHEGILTIRFEMPFNCWCLTCKKPIGMGVRYNAQKSKAGMYHSTPIYKFTMPCHLCAGTIVMQTDPQNFDYIILEGARRKEQKWNAEDNEQIVLADHSEKKKLALDAMYHLEHDVQDKTKALEFASAIQQLESDRQCYHDDFELNQIARKKFRENKRKFLEKVGQDNQLLTRLSLTGSEVQLLPEAEEDSSSAKLLRLTQIKRESANSSSQENSTVSIDDQAIFDHDPKKSSSSSSALNSTSPNRAFKTASLVILNSRKRFILKKNRSAFSLKKSTTTTTNGLNNGSLSGDSQLNRNQLTISLSSDRKAPKKHISDEKLVHNSISSLLVDYADSDQSTD